MRLSSPRKADMMFKCLCLSDDDLIFAIEYIKNLSKRLNNKHKYQIYCVEKG